MPQQVLKLVGLSTWKLCYPKVKYSIKTNGKSPIVRNQPFTAMKENRESHSLTRLYLWELSWICCTECIYLNKMQVLHRRQTAFAFKWNCFLFWHQGDWILRHLCLSLCTESHSKGIFQLSSCSIWKEDLRVSSWRLLLSISSILEYLSIIFIQIDLVIPGQ